MADPNQTPRLEESVGFHPAAFVAALVLPGLGHVVRGEQKRGVLAMIGILGMFLGGLLVGGLDAVDRRTEFWWFVPQSCVGPLPFLVDYVKKERFLVRDIDRATGQPALRPAAPDEDRLPNGQPTILPAGKSPPYVRAMGKSYEIGLLFAALAGMANVIVIIDAGFPTRRPTKPQTGGVAA